MNYASVLLKPNQDSAHEMSTSESIRTRLKHEFLKRSRALEDNSEKIESGQETTDDDKHKISETKDVAHSNDSPKRIRRNEFVFNKFFKSFNQHILPHLVEH